MSSPTSTRRRQLVAAAVFVMAIYVLMAVQLEAQNLGAAISRLGVGGLLTVLALSALNYALRFWRWHRYLLALGHQLPPALHSLYYVGGFAFTVSPGKAGEAVRGFYLKRHRVPYSHTLAALFAERVVDVLSISLLALVCAGAFAGYQMAALALGVAIFALAWLLGRPSLQAWLRHKASGAGPRMRRAIAGTASTLENAQSLMSGARLYPALLIGLVAWGAEGYGLWLLAEALEIHLSISGATAIYAIGVLAGAITFFVPGGLGGMEAAMTALLVKFGAASLSVAAAITLLCRFATLWFAVVLGLLALIALELRDGKQRGDVLTKAQLP